ncbi:hypothetical protein MED01_004298 [Micromonospora sp. MED01]|nr:hypothetical protein [Micromonospora alfalfae]MCG5460872.1 hypothetical protein [Micromonospora alfalfae]
MAEQDKPMRVLGGKPWKRSEWAGTSSNRPTPAGGKTRRPTGRTVTREER